MELRVDKPSGTIFYLGQQKKGQVKQTDYLALILRGGHVELRFNVGAGLMVIRSPKKLKMKKFHVVTLHWSVSEGSAFLQVDDQRWQAAIPENPYLNQSTSVNHTFEPTLPVILGYVKGAKKLSSTLNNRFGGLRNGFTGCIQSLRITNSQGYARLYSLLGSSKDVLFGRDIGKRDSD